MSHQLTRTMRQHAFVMGVVVAALACASLGQDREEGEYAVPFEAWKPNGVPYVSVDNEVFPSYDERAVLTWVGVVC